jgi:hypothetical protein
MDKFKTILIFAYLVVAITLTCGTPALIEWRKRKKWKKMYDSVQIGDKYIRLLREGDPFAQQWGEMIIITGKAMNKNGVPYVKYLRGCLESSDRLSYLMETLHYEPYNNQDKKQ